MIKEQLVPALNDHVLLKNNCIGQRSVGLLGNGAIEMLQSLGKILAIIFRDTIIQLTHCRMQLRKLMFKNYHWLRQHIDELT